MWIPSASGREEEGWWGKFVDMQTDSGEQMIFCLLEKYRPLDKEDVPIGY